MKVSLEKNKLAIEFAYNPIIVAVVTILEGRVFDAKTKKWYVPPILVKETCDILVQYGFSFTADVIELYKARLIFHKKIERLKKGDFKDSEKELLSKLQLPLYTYQQIGAGYLTGVKSGLIGDQPGLGKTIQTLATTELADCKKVLIFCPVSMKKTWQEEIEKWLPHKTSVIISGDVKQRDKLWKKEANYYICNYHLLLRDLKHMKKHKYDCILVDEATTISNPSSKTTKNLKKLKAQRRIAMTGTPLNNTLQDIWSIMDFCQPGLLGTFWQFTKEYCLRNEHNAITGFKNVQKLHEKISPFMLRRLKSDVLQELPPKVFENIWVELSSEERHMYDVIRRGLKDELRTIDMFDKKYLSKALVKMVRLKQMACSMELINGKRVSAKTDALKELLATLLANGEKTIVFTAFKEMAVLLMRDLAEYKPLLIAGGVSQEERDANRHMFNNDDEHKILIMTSAGAMGLNLQRASSVIHFDLPWSISVLEQREDRAHRHGQKKSVTVYRMLVEDSIDEYILKVLHAKKGVSNDVLGDEEIDEFDKVNLSTDDIQNILG